MARRLRTLVLWTVALVLLVVLGSWLLVANRSPVSTEPLSPFFIPSTVPSAPTPVTDGSIHTAVYFVRGSESQKSLRADGSIVSQRLDQMGYPNRTLLLIGALQVQITAPKGSHGWQAALSAATSPGRLLLRPVIAYAPPYDGHSRPTVPLPSVPVPAALQLVTQNLEGSPSSGYGVHYSTFPDFALSAYPSTTPQDESPTAVALLPGLPGGPAPRYLVGPAGLTGNIVGNADASRSSSGQPVLNVNLTVQGSYGWNAMAERYFHELIAFEVDGIVLTAPITLPTQTSFESFGSTIQISGGFTFKQVQRLAAQLNTGALPVPLIPAT